jgi:hypothetical protein
VKVNATAVSGASTKESNRALEGQQHVRDRSDGLIIVVGAGRDTYEDTRAVESKATVVRGQIYQHSVSASAFAGD